MSRLNLFREVCADIGSDVLTIKDAGAGWPGLITLTTSEGIIPVALHVSTVSSHSRQPYEKRFQNPANSSPVVSPNGAIPLLVGLFKEEDQPSILVAVNGASRLGRHTRFSILFNQRIIKEAQDRGWAFYVSGTGEKIYALNPRLLPVFVDSVLANTDIPSKDITSAISASGLLEDNTDESANRARRTASQLVRDNKFSECLRDAYGNVCAMCELGINLVVGAHIYPVSAPGSRDVIWNGIPLCQNHHYAFDHHDIWIDPDSRNILFHPSILNMRETNRPVNNFILMTRATLLEPSQRANRPRREMFVQRYEYFAGSYDWVE